MYLVQIETTPTIKGSRRVVASIDTQSLQSRAQGLPVPLRAPFVSHCPVHVGIPELCRHLARHLGLLAHPHVLLCFARAPRRAIFLP